MNGVHELRLTSLAFFTFVEMILYVCEWSRATRRAESWVLHCVEVRGGGQGVTHRYKRKLNNSPLVKEFVQTEAGLVTSSDQGTQEMGIERMCETNELKSN